MTDLTCTHAGCEADATRVMAMPPASVPCYFIAPYCDEHAEGVHEMGGLPASGPALSRKAEKIGGIHD